jgi:hypothetical protein
LLALAGEASPHELQQALRPRGGERLREPVARAVAGLVGGFARGEI